MALNHVVLMGRLTKDPDVRYTNKSDGTQMAIARYSLAVGRIGKDAPTDYISCVAFGIQGEFAEKYLRKGTKMVVSGRIQTGSYEKDGRKIYTTDVVIESQEFAESKGKEDTPPASEEFISVPDGIENDLPFK